MFDDLVGQVMHIDDRLGDAGVAELVEHVVEQWLAGHPHQRLRYVVGEGPHTHAEAGGEDHGFGGVDGHLLPEILEFALPMISRLRCKDAKGHSHRI